jgi:hypothetical protein
MNKNSINARLVHVESRLRKRTRFRVLIIEGGLPGPASFARSAGRRWQREVDEPYEVFERRVIDEANAAGLNSVVIGGLPDGDFSFLPGGSTPEKPEGDDYDEVPSEGLLMNDSDSQR